MITFGSVCSGIEAASVAWNPLGWKASWLSEIEPFPCALLKARFPDVINLGDMTAIPDLLDMGLVEAPDVFCGGTPCQAFSVAGRRLSLDDERGNLSLVFTEIADAIDKQRIEQGKKPAVIFWENVPGVLRTKDNAFGCFLGQLAGADAPLSPGTGRWPNCGFVAGPKRNIAWRILDAQYFGVPQRRRRVFVVASARERERFDPTKVLFEQGRLPGYPVEGREQKEETAGPSYQCNTGEAPRAVIMDGFQFGGWRESPVCGTITSSISKGVNGGNQLIVSLGMDRASFNQGRNAKFGFSIEEELCPTITAKGPCAVVCGGMASGKEVSPRVRRITPMEGERLQGFPDNWTRISWRGKAEDKCPDTPRYKAIGNSWAVPVVRWLGKRIMKEMNK